MSFANKIPTRRLGANGPSVSAIGLGTMGDYMLMHATTPSFLRIFIGIGAFYGKTDEKAAYEALTYSADRGMTFWDCADVYGTSAFAAAALTT